MGDLYLSAISDTRRKCAACGRLTGTKNRPGVVSDWPCYVEGYPCGYWGRVETGRMICAIHSFQVDRGRGCEEVRVVWEDASHD